MMEDGITEAMKKQKTVLSVNIQKLQDMSGDHF